VKFFGRSEGSLIEKGAYFPRFGRARGVFFLWFFAGTLMPFWRLFMVSEKNRMNISLDYARGREGDAVYFYIGEAF